LKASDNNSVGTQLNLGVYHNHGYGVKQDYVEALVWYTKALEWYAILSDNGVSNAQYYIGLLYCQGNDDEKIIKKLLVDMLRLLKQTTIWMQTTPLL
jgi:TPR repeat protein